MVLVSLSLLKVYLCVGCENENFQVIQVKELEGRGGLKKHPCVDMKLLALGYQHTSKASRPTKKKMFTIFGTLTN